MKVLRFFAVAVALTALLAGCATTSETSVPSASPPSTESYSDPPLIDESHAAGPTSVPGSLESP
jgi:hypothetical protein